MKRSRLRKYLLVPHHEKEEAKKHAARWDPDRRLWWIAFGDLASNPATYQWIDPANPMRQRVEAAANFVYAGTVSVPLFTTATPSLASPRTDFRLPECACPTPPWLDCDHTPPDSEVYPEGSHGSRTQTARRLGAHQSAACPESRLGRNRWRSITADRPAPSRDHVSGSGTAVA